MIFIAAGPSVAFCREVPIQIMMRTHHALRLRMVKHAMLPADFIPDFGDLATCLYSEMVLVYVRLQLHYTEIFIAATHHHVPVLLPPSGLLSA